MSILILNTFPRLPPSDIVLSQSGVDIVLATGDVLTDLTGGGTSYCNVGWNNPVVNQALIHAIESGGHSDIKLYNDPRREQLARLMKESSDLDFGGVYFSGHSGADGCEAAMKLSFQIQRKKNENRNYFIYRKGSYHGTSSDAAAVSDRLNLRVFDPILKLDNKLPVSLHSEVDAFLRNSSLKGYLAQSLEEIERLILQKGPENICAFVAETFTGGLSGFHPPLSGYWEGVSQILTKYGIHLILDEVIVGQGATGCYHAIEGTGGITPDFLVASKGLTAGYAPLSVVMIKQSIYERLMMEERINHSQTFQGHGPSVAVAIAVQKIVSDPTLLSQVAKNFETVKAITYSSLIRKSRFAKIISGRGHRFSIVYDVHDSDKFGRSLSELVKHKDQILIDGKWNRISFSPALTIERQRLFDSVELVCKRFLNLEADW